MLENDNSIDDDVLPLKAKICAAYMLYIQGDPFKSRIPPPKICIYLQILPNFF